jgi:threonine/homoserine/homoserine lactone efflux protein
MMDAEKFAAFVLVSGLSSLVPGPSMLFVMGQAMWRGARSGAAALAGVQLGYIGWWLLAALGLGTLAATFPLAFRALAIGGAVYLGWLGVQALRHVGAVADTGGKPARKPSRHAFRDGVFVALSNPKALVYIVALLPLFVDRHSPIGPQLVLLALVAMVIDVALGALYIGAGNRLSAAMARPPARKRLDRTVGTIFLLIAVAILLEPLRA